jgi:hypothetical protein
LWVNRVRAAQKFRLPINDQVSPAPCGHRLILLTGSKPGRPTTLSGYANAAAKWRIEAAPFLVVVLTLPDPAEG